MDLKEYKSLFGHIAESYGFENCFGGWVNVTDDRIMVMTLQNSNYGGCFDLNVKFYIQGLESRDHTIDKNLIQNEVGDVFRRQPEEHHNSLKYEELKVQQAEKLILKLFEDFVAPLANKTVAIQGIVDCFNEKELYLLPAIKEKLLNRVQ